MRTVKKFTDFTKGMLNESEILNEDAQHFLQLDHKLQEMRKAGLTEDQINEGLFDILSFLGDGFADRLKNYAAAWMMEKLGIPQADRTGEPYFLAEWVKNVVEAINFRRIGSYFGKGACKNWMVAVTDGLLETAEEKGIQILLRNLGMNIDFSGGIGGTIVGTLRETITNSVNNTKFVQHLEHTISGWLCNLSFTDLVKGKLSGDDKSKLAQGVKQQGPENINNTFLDSISTLFKS